MSKYVILNKEISIGNEYNKLTILFNLGMDLNLNPILYKISTKYIM